MNVRDEKLGKYTPSCTEEQDPIALSESALASASAELSEGDPTPRDPTPSDSLLISFSQRLRIMYAALSSSMPRSCRPEESSPDTKSCEKVGMVRSAPSPSIEESVGTSRHPSTSNPSERTMLSTAACARAAASRSCGRKAMPVAYALASGSGKSATALKNASGTCISTPAPSPVFTSAPKAPRCSKLHKAPSAVSTSSRLARPCISTTNPTPQASCS